MEATGAYTPWREELIQIADWIDRHVPGSHCPELLDVQMRERAERLRAIARAPLRSENGSLLQASVAWSAEDVADRYRCSHAEAEEFLESIEDDLQLEMIARGWQVIEGCCESDSRDHDG